MSWRMPTLLLTLEGGEHWHVALGGLGEDAVDLGLLPSLGLSRMWFDANLVPDICLEMSWRCSTVWQCTGQ